MVAVVGSVYGGKEEDTICKIRSLLGLRMYIVAM